MRPFLCFSLLLFSQLLASQSISVGFNDVHIGRNIDLRYGLERGKYEFSFGLKFHLNTVAHDNQNNVFKKRFYASSLSEHLGISLGFSRFIQLNEKNKLMLFYTAQFTRAGTKGESFSPWYWIGETVLYRRVFLEMDKLNVSENYLGIGLRSALGAKISLSFKIGIGGLILWNIPTTYTSGALHNFRGQSFELGRFSSIGLDFNLKRVD